MMPRRDAGEIQVTRANPKCPADCDHGDNVGEWWIDHLCGECGKVKFTEHLCQKCAEAEGYIEAKAKREGS